MSSESISPNVSPTYSLGKTSAVTIGKQGWPSANQQTATVLTQVDDAAWSNQQGYMAAGAQFLGLRADGTKAWMRFVAERSNPATGLIVVEEV